MTWEEVLGAIQGLLGRRVVLTVDSPDAPAEYLPGGFGPRPPIQVLGVLHRGEPDRLLRTIREGLPLAAYGDEVISFVLGGEDTEIDLNLTRSLFSGGTRVAPDIGVEVVHGGLTLTVVDHGELMHAVAESSE